MGRYVYESGNFVWKYAFASQNSEQHLIAYWLKIGDVTREDDFGDTLRLERKDLPELEKALEPHCEMIQHYNKFVDALSADGFVNTRQDKILNVWLRANKYETIYFWSMVRAFINYIKRQPKKRRVFYFEGEY